MTDSTDHVIQVENLNKSFKILNKKPGLRGAITALFSRDYRQIKAVQDISFSIKPGELVGYVGPNGAGKSTTIKMLTGILYPSDGYIRIVGLEPFKNRRLFTRRIGVMFGQRTQLWWDLPLTESFDLLRSIYKISKEQYDKNIEYLNSILDFKEFWSQPVRRLSLGQRVRADLAAAVLHDPAVLFLDEPTIGLDIVAREKFRDMVKKINQDKNTTIIITSHDLDDIEKLANRLMLIDHGKLLYDGSLPEFLKQHAVTGQLQVIFDGNPDTKALESLDGVSILNKEKYKLELEIIKSRISYAELLARLPSAGEIRDIQILNAGLEHVLKGLYLQKP